MQKQTDKGHGKDAAGVRISRGGKRFARLLGWVALLGVAFLVVYGFRGKQQRDAAALETLRQAEAQVPLVRTAAADAITAPRQLDLPGTIRPFDSATIFARATGYISKRLVDIGSKVKAGDVLAIISAPDLDQQLAQARAQVIQ